MPFLNEWGRKILLWDQTWKFEMNRLEDGRYEVKHVCTKFQGPFPIRLIIWLHQRYVSESARAHTCYSARRYRNLEIFTATVFQSGSVLFSVVLLTGLARKRNSVL